MSLSWLGYERCGNSRRLRIDPDEEIAFFRKARMHRDIRRCFLWQGAKNDAGYGVHVMRGRHVAAHRASYAISIRRDPGTLLVVYRNRWSEPRRGGRAKPSSHASIVRTAA